MTPRLTFSIVLAAGLVLAGCSESKTGAGCKNDNDCGPGLFCDGGVCKCRTDDQCDTGEFCNAFGNCQPRPPCLGNHECPEGTICNSSDPTGGKCIPNTACGSPVHCELNSYCKVEAGADTGVCTSGCRNSGDCQLGWICVAGTCQAGASASDCHTCPASPNVDPTYCDYGEICCSGASPYAECLGNVGSCFSPPFAAGLCEQCGNGIYDCNTGLTCLIDPEETAAEYCAPACKTSVDCPAGYSECDSLISVCGTCTTSSPCGNGGTCLFPSESSVGSCTCKPENCGPPVLYCDGFEKKCAHPDYGVVVLPCDSTADCTFLGAGTCGGNGFCTSAVSCSTDVDCRCIDGKCVNSGLPCTRNTADHDCGSTFRELDDFPGEGWCDLNSKVCGKDGGFTCDTLTTGTSVCRELGQ